MLLGALHGMLPSFSCRHCPSPALYACRYGRLHTRNTLQMRSLPACWPAATPAPAPLVPSPPCRSAGRPAGLARPPHELSLS
eukprot:scaffold50915_cov66-Phaeocystis_antarctica.AAC.7